MEGVPVGKRQGNHLGQTPAAPAQMCESFLSYPLASRGHQHSPTGTGPVGRSIQYNGELFPTCRNSRVTKLRWKNKDPHTEGQCGEETRARGLKDKQPLKNHWPQLGFKSHIIRMIKLDSLIQIVWIEGKLNGVLLPPGGLTWNSMYASLALGLRVLTDRRLVFPWTGGVFSTMP